MKDENLFSRWSRRKIEAKTSPPPGEEPRPAAPIDPPAAAPAKATSAAGPGRPTADVVPAQAGTQSPQPLPPVESLTPESDFTPFMKPEVDPGVKRQALKALFRDPQFNVMDGLDVYIDDYSKPDPLPEGWLEKMNQVKHLGIFSEPAEAAPAVPGPGDEGAQKAVEEQPVDLPPEVEGSDTSSAQISPSQVGKLPPERGGDQDVLV